MPAAYVRGAFESVPGNELNTPTLSTKKNFFPVLSYQPSFGANPLDRSDDLRNMDEPISQLKDSFEPAWSMSVRGYPDTVGFLLKLLLGSPTTTAGNGVITDPDTVAIPTNAYRHVSTAPFGPAGSSPLTAQFDVAYHDQTTYFLQKGAALAELGLQTPEEGGSMLEASGPSLYTNTQSNPSLTPTYEAHTVPPFTRGGLSLPTWLAGSGPHEDFSLSVANPVEVFRSMGIASMWPDGMDKANEGTILVSGSLAKRQLDNDDIVALREATGFAAVARWVSSVNITASYPYKLYVAMANCQYVAGDPEELGNKRRHGASFDFQSTSTGSGSTTITLVNNVATYV